ncbi:hypothetical protein AAU61_17955 [Desulfocarbo indianensis]|nr:hypothetical protein AAU61_17955 [Desulfocarbo indianensis]
MILKMPGSPRAPLSATAHELVGQVRANCLRADAAVAGRFSMCGLLLRLRNLYKWETGMPPWREESPELVLDWVDQRERLWEEQQYLGPRQLELAGRGVDPFDVEAVNRLMSPEGLIYGAGLAGGMLPVFFLGRLAQTRVLNGLTVHTLGEEFSPDIYFLPGLRQGDQIYLRPWPLAYVLWDKIADPRPSQARFVDFGLGEYGHSRRRLLAEPSWAALRPILEAELEAVLWHEAGEAAAGERAAVTYQRAVAEHPFSEVEHFARGVKDLLADTAPGGRLHSIIEREASGALGLYPAWLFGFPRLLFPEIDAAVMEFMADRQWRGIEEVRRLGHARALEALDLLAGVLENGPGQATQERVRQEVILPLTGRRGLPPDHG